LVRGEVIDVVPAYEKDIIRIEIQDDKVKQIKEVHAINRQLEGLNR